MTEQHRVELLPGVWLRAVHTNKFKSSYLSITLMTPLDKKTASANALIPALLRRGSQSHPDMQTLAGALDELYGGSIEPAVRKKGETQCIGFVASFLDDAYTPDHTPVLEPAAQILGELLLKPLHEENGFHSAYFESEKSNLIDRIRAQINNKRSYAPQRLTGIMCQDEAYGVDRLGDEATAKAITNAGLWQQYQTLLQTAEIELYYCGSADQDRVQQALKQAFGALPNNPQRIVPDCEVRLSVESQPRVVEEPMNVTQGKLSIGFRTGGISVWEPEFPALMVMNAVYGGTTLSKLFMNVRERLSLCYYASSTIEKMKGIMMVSSGVEFDKYHQAKDEILAQLEAVKAGQIDELELEGARRILVGMYQSILDAQDGLEDFWLGQAAAGLDSGVEGLVTRLEAVTKEQVVQVAGRMQLDTIYFLKGQEG